MDYSSQPKLSKIEDIKSREKHMAELIWKQKQDLIMMKNHMELIKQELQTECGKIGHNFISELESGMYGETYTYCTNCQIYKY